jgi:adenylylsulfate kinase
MSKKGTVYFFTGLAGAGKTTIGGLFFRRLKARKETVILLDGDQVNPVFCEELGYTDADRRKGAKRIFRTCKMLSDQGMDVVVCSISMYDEVRDWNRANIENYHEVYVKPTWETLLKRNQKGLYTGAEKNVVGVDLPYDEPKHPDIVIQNDGHETPEEIVTRLERLFGLDAAKVVLKPLVMAG